MKPYASGVRATRGQAFRRSARSLSILQSGASHSHSGAGASSHRWSTAFAAVQALSGVVVLALAVWGLFFSTLPEVMAKRMIADANAELLDLREARRRLENSNDLLTADLNRNRAAYEEQQVELADSEGALLSARTGLRDARSRASNLYASVEAERNQLARLQSIAAVLEKGAIRNLCLQLSLSKQHAEVDSLLDSLLPFKRMADFERSMSLHDVERLSVAEEYLRLFLHWAEGSPERQAFSGGPTQFFESTKFDAADGVVENVLSSFGLKSGRDHLHQMATEAATNFGSLNAYTDFRRRFDSRPLSASASNNLRSFYETVERSVDARRLQFDVSISADTFGDPPLGDAMKSWPGQINRVLELNRALQSYDAELTQSCGIYAGDVTRG